MKEFIGIVEDIDDPLHLGRAKVRVINEHDTDVSTDDLKWSHVLMPVTSGSSQGVGDTPCLTVGSSVIGFYLDREEKQLAFILGSFPIIPDMDNDKHSISYLARGKQTLEKQQIGPEPASAYAAQYPHNRVITSKSGHVIEIDDTPENERIHIYHKSGSYTEINKEGQVVNKSVGDNYEIVQKNKTLYIEGDFDIEIKGTCSITCSTIRVTGDLIVDGKVISKDIELAKHKHTGVDTGSGITGEPT